MSVATARETHRCDETVIALQSPTAAAAAAAANNQQQQLEGEQQVCQHDAPPQQELMNVQVVVQKRLFLLFVKILFKSLEQSADRETRETAKAIVSDCTRRNRLGDPAFTPLMDAVDRLLRGKVGESHWRRAHAYMQHYLRRSERQQRMAMPVSSR